MAFDLESARKESNDDEIASFLSQKHNFDLNAAKKAGASTKDIADFLAPREITPQKEMANIPALTPQQEIAVEDRPLTTEEKKELTSFAAGQVPFLRFVLPWEREALANAPWPNVKPPREKPLTLEEEFQVRAGLTGQEAIQAEKNMPGNLTPEQIARQQEPTKASILGPEIVSAVPWILGMKPFVGRTPPKVPSRPEIIPKPQPQVAPPVTGTEFKYAFKRTPDVRKAVEEGMTKGTSYSFAGKGTPELEEQYINKAITAVRDIVENKSNLKYASPEGTTKAHIPRSLDEFDQANVQTKKMLWDQYHKPVEVLSGKGVRINPEETANLLDEISKSPAFDLEPGIKAYAKNQAKILKDRMSKGGYNPTDLEEMISKLNAKTHAFYKNPNYHTATRISMDAGISQSLRSEMDNVINRLTGTEWQELRNRYGAIRTIEDDVHRRAMVDARAKSKGFFDVADPFAAYHILRGILTGDVAGIVSGASAKAVSSWYKHVNDPNRIIKNMFTKVDRAIEMEKRAKWTPPPSFLPNLPVPAGPVIDRMTPQIEFWRGPGAKGVEPISPELNIIPPGRQLGFQGFTTEEWHGRNFTKQPGPTSPTSPPYYRPGGPSTLPSKFTPEELDKVIRETKDRLFKVTGTSRLRIEAAEDAIKAEFKAFTGLNYDEAAASRVISQPQARTWIPGVSEKVETPAMETTRGIIPPTPSGPTSPLRPGFVEEMANINREKELTKGVGKPVQNQFKEYLKESGKKVIKGQKTGGIEAPSSANPLPLIGESKVWKRGNVAKRQELKKIARHPLGYFGEEGAEDILEWTRSQGGIRTGTKGADVEALRNKESGLKGGQAIVRRNGKGFDELYDIAMDEGKISASTTPEEFQAMMEKAIGDFIANKRRPKTMMP